MKTFEKSIEKYFDKSLKTSALFEMIEEQMNDLEMASRQMTKQALNEAPKAQQKRKSIIDLLPKIQISEDWGDPETASRQLFEKYMNRVEGAGLPDKIAFINNFVEGEAGDIEQDVGNIISSLIFLELLATIIQQFSPSGAGFLFEAFLAGLLRGKQVTGKVEGQLPIDDIRIGIDPETGEGGKPLSLKLLSSTTAVHGSTTNLINFLASSDGEDGVEYVVAIKWGDKVLSFYSFTIDRDNILSWIGNNFSGYSLSNNLSDLRKFRENKSYDLPMMTEREGDDDYEEQIERFKKEYDEVGVAAGMVHGISPRGRGARERAASIMMNAPQETVAKLKQYAIDAGFEKANVEDLLHVYNSDGEIDEQATLDQRRKLLAAVVAKLSPKHPMGKPYSRDYSSSKDPLVDQLNKKMRSLAARDPQKWANILIRAMINKQFSIDPKFYQTKRLPPHMRQKRYGHIELDKAKIRQVAENYAKILQETVLPIYEALDSFNAHLLEYFVDGNMNAGADAIADAKELKTQTDQKIN